MEYKDWIATGAFVVSIVALCISAWSIVYTKQQADIATKRYNDEAAARKPVFDVQLRTTRPGREWQIMVTVSNRDTAKIKFDFVTLEESGGARLAALDDKGNADPSVPVRFLDSVAPFETITWKASVLVPDEFAAMSGKPGSLVFAYRRLDDPKVQLEPKIEIIFPR